VSAIHLLPGQSVQPGQTLLTLIARSAGTEHDSSGKLVAHLYAPSRSIGFLRKGQRVHLRYDAFPYQKFGMAAGVVAAVSRTPFAPSELPQNVAQQLVARLGAQEALFRAVVELDSQAVHARGVDWPLKPGLMLDADVKQEERAVWEWLLEPLLAWRRVM
jgi:membrane fusion protein